MKTSLRLLYTRAHWLILGLLLVACTGKTATDLRPSITTPATATLIPRDSLIFLPITNSTSLPTATYTPSPPSSPSPTSTLSPTLTPTPAPSIWLASCLPARFREAFKLPVGAILAYQPEQANLRIEVGNQDPVSQWVYVLVAPFPTIPDGVSSTDLMNAWAGQPSGPFIGQPLLMDESTYGVLAAWWGEPTPQMVKILPAGQLLDYAWTNRPSWAIVPFEDIEPRWKVLEVDSISPLRKDFDPTAYILTVPFTLDGDQSLVGMLRAELQSLPATNRDPEKLTTVLVTGVTALVRGTAWTMEREGILYPAQDIRDWLRDADILHISNEIPFDPSCPPPNPAQPDLRFCSNPSYIALLEDIGTDVVELTGDHFADRGTEATLLTLQMYRDRGWPYYGGGANAQQARQALTLEHNGNKIAFIGCNAKGGGYATASDTQPGAVKCDFEWMHAEVARLRHAGYLSIVTFQHQETENLTYKMMSEFRPDFQGMAEAGAVIVSGSQAHQPFNIEFDGDAFIHYGLGNLFFDQYRYYAEPITDRAFLDRHIIYDGRYIGTELLTIQFIDLARSRPMTPEERAAFLQTIFEASGW